MSTTTSSRAIVDAAVAMAPLVAAAATEIDEAGRLPQEIVSRLSAAGLYQLFLPAAVGGPEVDPLTALLAIEALAAADGSVAWCASVSSALSAYMAWLSTDALTEMTGGAEQPDLRFSGSARPLGKAWPVEGGFRVQGRWDFASNCLHANWYTGTCVIQEEGRERARAMVIPIAEGEIIDTWRVTGMRGTGSNDFAVHDVFVPEERMTSLRHALAQPGRIFNQRLTMVVTWSPTAGVALGLAKGALEAFTAMSEQTTANQADKPLRRRRDVQQAVGRAAAQLGAARAYCVSAIGEAWEAVGAEAQPTVVDAAICQARLAITHAMHTAVDVVNVLFHAGGTRSIFEDQGVERRFRDAHVAVQHAAGLPAHFESGGRVLLGLPADAPYW